MKESGSSWAECGLCHAGWLEPMSCIAHAVYLLNASLVLPLDQWISNNSHIWSSPAENSDVFC